MLPKYSIPIQSNVKNKQEIHISAKHAFQNAVAMATADPITKILPHYQINLRKSLMIWKDYFKLSEIASYSKLARALKAPPPGGIG